MTNVHRIGLARDLYERGQSGKPIRIGLIGCGEMGTDILSQVAHMHGIEVVAVADAAGKMCPRRQKWQRVRPTAFKVADTAAGPDGRH